MDKYGVKSTYDALRNKLLNYINTVYLGKNDFLREACEEELQKIGVLSQEPFIEANPAYLTILDGIAKSEVPADVKTVLTGMIQRGLGVFPNPYKHQVDALTEFYNGNDLFVATGTGSGKTECFMWPMVSKIVREQMNSPQTWKVRGVRAIMLYPMNALVSDQLGRLRRMIGNGENGFHNLVESLAPGSRIPQFGMYTGRTPYPGNPNADENKKYAATLRKDLLNQSEEVKEKLVELGKFPSKSDLLAFVERLENNGSDLTAFDDAELIMRQEMQQHCPDILITNYSMLEYMLMRPIEKNIWESTISWLNSNPENKLLFIIDEAHMYRGSSGGEVSLLIRRVLHKLGIDRKKVQFILTSASIPSAPAEQEKVKKFACDLSAQAFENNTFKLITGKTEPITHTQFTFDPTIFADYDIDELQKDWAEKCDALRKFAELIKAPCDCDFDSETSVSVWLYKLLGSLDPMLSIMEKTRGHATSLKELSEHVFPGVHPEIAEKAVSVLLAIAPLAKSENGQVLYPARLHMMFRGLQGLYACTNPNCSETTYHNPELGLGKIYLNNPGTRCKCGGMVYELLNERACGALFLRGYIDTTETREPFVWTMPGVQPDENFKEVHFYILPHDGSFPKPKGDIKTGWLNTISGRLHSGIEDHSGDAYFIPVAYCNKEVKGRPDILTFRSCPKCAKNHFEATDFSTKGNEPFFNLVSEQFYVQPPVPKYSKLPNAGRKVLLFSDSRQRAAVLAKDLTRAADEDAMKKALTVAAAELQEWAAREHKAPTLNLLYAVFLKVAYKNGLRFFYGNNETDLLSALEEMQKLYEKKGDNINYERVSHTKFKTVPDQFYEHLLRQMCSNFRSLTDVGMCWLEPYDDNDGSFEEIEDIFDDSNVPMSIEEFKVLFSAWAMEIMTSEYALGSEITDDVRRIITAYHQRLGVEDDKKLPPRIKKMLEAQGYGTEQINAVAEALSLFLQQGKNTPCKYLNLDMVTLRFDEKHSWFKCPRCSGIFPFTVWGKCAHCGKGEPKLMNEKDFAGINFWRDPVIRAVHGDPQALMTRINTEEHTAQLSHKDQRQKTWSTTEDFEMRFQNVHIDNDRPVDVLSCTTTMEVGIDIGSLTAVGLRNIPPMRENYQQRAGRAGRRSAAISTIVTFTDNRPHDSFYFHHPESIISGEPRTPWIDANNHKLAYRHLNVICFTEFFDSISCGADKVGISEFFRDMYERFKGFIKGKNFSQAELKSLLPADISIDILKYKRTFWEEIESLKESVENFPDEYKEDDNTEKSVLDVLLESGIFPTYSFPKDVVGFHIENFKGDRVDQKPDRALEMAISEYAPGRLVVVNKTTYKSGGVYSFHSKFRAGEQETPARPFFDSKDYFKTLYYCSDSSCNWMGLDYFASCPFCGKQTIVEQKMLKPWGFAPINGRPTKEAEAEADLSYAEAPSYSITPKEDEMIASSDYANVRYAKRSDDPLIILNMGPKKKGFMVCQDCGAAVPGDDEAEFTNQRVNQPYRHPLHPNTICRHPSTRIVNTYLGHQFRTDLLVFEMALDPYKVNTETAGLWIKRAGQSVAEAMVLAAGRILDIEFNEIKSGYRIRYDYNKRLVYVDVFLFDSLSSGAGYCATLSEQTSRLLKETEKVLEYCPNKCDSACHDCLQHFWNQRVHTQLDRFAGLELLKWCKNSALAAPLTYRQQDELLKPLGRLSPRYQISRDGTNHYVECNGQKIRIYVYPAMWNKYSKSIPQDAIAISDKSIKYALPQVDAIIRERIEN